MASPTKEDDVYNAIDLAANSRPSDTVPVFLTPAQWQDVAARLRPQARSFQVMVWLWMQNCFSASVRTDKSERLERFLEESLELVQSLGMGKDHADALVRYVFDRKAGEPKQEVGGVAVTLAALCTVFSIDEREAAEKELARVWKYVEKIREKQLAKPKLHKANETCTHERLQRRWDGDGEVKLPQYICLDCGVAVTYEPAQRGR